MNRVLRLFFIVMLFLTAQASSGGEAGRTGFSDALAQLDLTLEALPGQPAVHRWSAGHKGGVRLVGQVQKQSPGASAEFQVLIGGQPLWNHAFADDDLIPHGFDMVVYDLVPDSTVELAASVGPGSTGVKLVLTAQVVPEPFVSRWCAELPSGYPNWTEAEQAVLRRQGQDILHKIREASAARQPQIIIPPGEYLFHANWSHASTLKDLAELEIVAAGVTFWFEPPAVHALLFENCRNVTVRGLTIDFTLPCWFQARVTEVDRQAKTLRAALMPGYPPRNPNGVPESAGNRAFMFYDPQGRFINHRHTPTDWQLEGDGKTLLCKPGRYGIPAALKPGDYAVGTIRTGAALRSRNCAGMRFEDVNIWSSPGMAAYEGGGAGGNIYRRVRATRRPHTSRLHAFGADIFHLAGADRGPMLERCEMAYGADDNLNIHGSFGRVVKQSGERIYYMEGAYESGDTLEFRDQNSVELLGIAKILSVSTPREIPSVAINDQYMAKGEFLVELDKALELPPLALVVMDGKRSGDHFVLRDCWLHDNFQRTLINGSPNGLIENNTLQNLGMGICVQFETWGPWMEGPFARNLTIRNNRFIDSPPDGSVISVSMHPGGNRKTFQARPVTNMSITGNYFGRTALPPLSIKNVDGLMIQGNSFDFPDRAPEAPATATETTVNWLHLQECDNVSILNNWQQVPRPAAITNQ